MRTMQQVFNAVISHGYYNPWLRKHFSEDSMIPRTSAGQRRSYYMCNALNFAEQDEHYHNAIAIQQYLQSSRRVTVHSSIVYVWNVHNIVCEPIDLIKLYRDWESRPSLDYVRC